jgi:L-threonylcarbamoyladenylate synthase
MPVHYAPHTPAYHVSSLEELAGLDAKDYALIVIGDHHRAGTQLKANQFWLVSPEDASRGLYDALHRCDALAKEAIVVVLPADLPDWRAVRDRVIRASRPLVASVK